MSRDVESLRTTWRGIEYRSRTEARWAVFFDALGIHFAYEPQSFRLSTGSNYLPDFYLTHFSAWFEVKPAHDAIVTDECVKARTLAKDQTDRKVWLAMGVPAADKFNVLPLEKWNDGISIEDILGPPENRFQFQEDRRDEDVFWLRSNEGSGMSGFVIGGPGKSTPHFREPLVHRRVEAAYAVSANEKFG